MESRFKNTEKKQITIYGTESALRALKRTGIKPGQYNGLFLESAEITMTPIDELDHITSMTYCYFLDNDWKKLRGFKADLIEKYGGGFPHLLGNNRELYLSEGFTWSTVFILLLFISGYEVLSQRKRNALLCVLGDDIHRVIRNHILLDVIFLTLVWFGVNVANYYFTGITFMLDKVLILFVAFLTLNSLVLLRGNKIQFRRDLSNQKSGQLLLRVNYAIKFFSIIVVVILAAENIFVMQDGYQYYKQGDFFRRHRDYSIYQLNYTPDNNMGKTIEDEYDMNLEFCKRFWNNMIRYGDRSDSSLKNPVLNLNRKSAAEIGKENAEIRELIAGSSQKETLLLYPKSISQEEKGQLEGWVSDNQKANVSKVPYSSPLKTVGISVTSDGMKSRFVRNPVLLIDFREPSQLGIPKKDEEWDYDCAYDIMYRIPQRKFNAFVKEFGLKNQIVVKTNVLDAYTSELVNKVRAIRLSAVLLLLLLLLEGCLISLVIRQEYRINAVENVLKKLSGYGLFERNRKLLLFTGTGDLTGAAIAGILLHFAGGQEQSLLVSAGVGVVLFLAEGYVIFREVRKTEKESLNLIIKGASI